MRAKVIVTVLCWGLVSSLALAEKEGRREDPARGDRAKAIAKVLLWTVLERESVPDVSPAGITVDFADETVLGVTVTARDGQIMTLDFEPNETSDVLRPVLPEGIEPEIFGMKPEFFLFRLMLQDADGKKGSLEPFDENTASIPHDDITVFVLDEELVLLFLWQRGEVVGTFYAMDVDGFDAEEAGAVQPDDAVGGVAAAASPVCNKLEAWCVSNRYDMPTVIACGLWLLFCRGVE